jgi:hypothetical protein
LYHSNGKDKTVTTGMMKKKMELLKSLMGDSEDQSSEVSDEFEGKTIKQLRE